MNINHSSKSNEWYTPKDIMDRVRGTLGYISLDPASCTDANETVKAKHFFTEGALEKSWEVEKHNVLNIFVNPPGGKTKNKSNVVLFWEKLRNTRFRNAIFLAYSIEALQTSQNSAARAMGDFTLCIPSKRIRFVSPDGKKNSPSHASAIIYVPGSANNDSMFRYHFKSLGTIIN